MGEKEERACVGEILVGPATALFMDEISTGLDSSTTFKMVKFIKQMVCAMDAQVIISLLQPAPETFELFDDIILLSEGQVVYQGPRENILEFFTSVGFKCPQRKGVADFLQEVTSRRDQEQYWFREDKPYRYVPVSEFSNSFKSFHVGEQLSRNLSVPFDTSKVHPSTLTAKRYGISSWDLMRACFAREWLLMRRNSFVYVFKTTQLIILAAITIGLFRGTKMPHETIADGGAYYGAIFFGLVSIMFNGYADLIMTAVRLPVFYKQRDSLVYPAWAFGLSYLVLRVPISLLESGIWVVLTYYGIGFAPGASRFFKQFLAYFFVHQTALTQFRFVASVGRTLLMSHTLGFFSNLLVFVLGGFIIAKDDIQPWWIWTYWLSPMTYGLNAVAINEFLDIRWSKPNSDSKLDASTIGKAILESRAVPVDSFWYWRSIGTLFGFILLFNLCFILALTYLSPSQKSQGVIANVNESESKMNHETRMDNVEKSIELQNASIGPIVADTTMLKTLKNSRNYGKLKHSVLREVSLPFKRLSLVFNELNYYIDMPSEMKESGVQGKRLQLLRNVSGAFRPGLLTALIGVTGAGKTTLLDVLAGRKTGGYIEGNISVSGYPKRQETFARISGYCEQNDIHSPNVTVHESLMFSAFLRLSPEIDLKTKKMFVEEIMDLVELNLLRDAMVGLSGVDGLSTEQRKRLTIAVELVANPSIIFMDEPTSGLDARAAAIVMRAIRNTVNTGRTVVCTIHQPSIDIFETFDELLLMQRGGQLIYAGELGHHSSHLIEYFESIPGVPKIPEGYNPATWVLEITSPSFKPWLKLDFAEVYERSSIYKRNQELINELSIPSSGSMDLAFSKRYAQSFVAQCSACFWKQYRAYWRNPQYNGIRFFSTCVTALIFCTVFWRKGMNIDKQQDLFNLLGAIYAAILFVGCNNANCVLPIVAIERTVFNRERAAGMYSSFAYAFAQVCIEIIYIAAQSLLYSLLLYSLIDFGWKLDKFFWFFLLMFMCLVYFTCFGMMTVAITPNQKVANVLIFFFYCLWNLFSGFIIPRKLMPFGLRWLFWANPVAWSLHGIVVSQLGELNNMVKIPGEPSMDVRTFLEQKLGYRHDFLGYIALVHVCFALFFIFIFAFSIKFLNFQKR
ncbi:hypothetical protein HPP92_024267 [Vanilla planifolia]|uniref:ABC transporter domain-containing protein n=1 Tax=Vanilla planifolia TaxID=51239 RepID=A0A835PRP5_VANPL|nr:hypothetical protein HPP92_024267 [Vanilla planifolia]